jgi:oxygen-independent coproporphyrinogen-3 oxidase
MANLSPTLGIYVHIPFCRTKCGYCAFVSQVENENLQQAYVAALCREITAAGGDFSAFTVDSIFLGGGTPTVLPVDQLVQILQNIRADFALSADAEISIEANPGTVSFESLKLLRQTGFNRLSLGVQSFDDSVLAAVGRLHRADQAKTAFQQARQAGFENIGLDLIYGLPEQTAENWQASLEQAVALNPEHLSAYGLKLEDETPLAVAVANGATRLPSEEVEESMYDMLNDFLPLHGYQRYEIANYAKTGRQCRHNLKYWSSLPFRGFGLAAHSFDGRQRFANTTDLGEYIERSQAGLSVEAVRESLDEAGVIGEYVFTALRLTRGMSFDEFHERFGQDFLQLFAEPLGRLKKMQLIDQTDQVVFLTPRGMKFGNQVFAEFLP